MRCFQSISTILGFAMLSAALPQALPYRSVALSRRHVAIKHAVSDIDALALKDFELSGFLSTSIPDSSNTSFNRSLNFTFMDPNSNSSTSCSHSWIDTANTTGAPFGPSYLVCSQTAGVNGSPEYFDWFLVSYTDLCHFSIESAHEFSDPKQYPPPYNYVEYFASTNVSLAFADAAGTSCTLPTSTSPLKAKITSITN